MRIHVSFIDRVGITQEVLALLGGRNLNLDAVEMVPPNVYIDAPTLSAEVLQELIQIAKDIRTARARGEEQGLSPDEIAFYDALADNDSALQVLGDDKLKLIAHELLVKLKDNLSVDWARRDAARARMRVLVKRILRHYGYPPDLQDAAVQTVLQQAEQLSSTWTLPGYAGSM